MHRVRLLASENQRRPFTVFAHWIAATAGRPATFLVACTAIIVWALLGPSFGYSTTWQLFVNTGTTIVTFLMVFLIQNTQNRDSIAVQIKLDELIRANPQAHTALLDLEELTEEELIAIRNRYEKLAQEARQALRRGRSDTGVPII